MENYIQNRYDFVFLFDVKDGNPNGDPDFDNQPRIDFETREGLVSDVCIKRKVRNYIQLKVEAGELVPDKYDIFIRQGNTLNDIINSEKEKAGKDDKKGRMNMCDRFFDISNYGHRLVKSVFFVVKCNHFFAIHCFSNNNSLPFNFVVIVSMQRLTKLNQNIVCDVNYVIY